jgi:hypothetical protein
MALPSYILCSQSGVEDRTTGFLSHFHVIEKIRFSRTTLPASQVPMSQMWLCAVWLAEEQDIGKEFEFETRAFMPDESALEIGNGTFIFSSSTQHITFLLFGGVPINGPGMLRLRCQIRCVAGGEWISQEYKIIVEEFGVPSPAHLDEQGGSHAK